MIYRFDQFELNEEEFRLTKGGEPVAVEPRALRLLSFLVRNPGRLIPKQELFEQVWQDAAVGDNALTRSVALLRKVLGDSSREPRMIETVAKVGYRFLAPVVVVGVESFEAAVPPAEVMPVVEPGRRWGWRAVAVVCGCVVLVAGTAVWGVKRRASWKQPIRSIAVLPLENLSGNPAEEFFADGTTDELITELARIPNLRVVSRSSAMQEKGTHKSLAEVARELGVDAVVEGSVVRSGEKVRINAQLVDARTDEHLWAKSFEGTATDAVSLEDEVAMGIAEHARLAVAPRAGVAATAQRPVDPVAHMQYLRGLNFFDKRDARNSVASFRQALDTDPAYASAYAGLAAALQAEALLGLVPQEEAIPQAVAAAKKALELDPENGDAYIALGGIQAAFLWDWPAAEASLKRGMELAPSNPMGQMWFAIYLESIGKMDEAVEHARRAVDLDPLSFFQAPQLASALYFARRYDEALKQLQVAEEMQPGGAKVVNNWRSWIYEKKGDYGQAVNYDLLALGGRLPEAKMASLRAAYTRGGWKAYEEARVQIDQTDADKGCAFYYRGVGLLRIGNKEQGLAALQRGQQEHCFWMGVIVVDPMLDSVRNDPGYIEMVRRLKLPEVASR